MLALPRRPPQLGPHDLGRVDLHDDLALEVAAGVEVEVLVRRAREAVVAHHAVGDEVPGCGRDVVQLLCPAQGLDRRDAGAGIRLDRRSLDHQPAPDRGIGEMEEAQPLPQSATDADVPATVGVRRLLDGAEAEVPQAGHRPPADQRVAV